MNYILRYKHLFGYGSLLIALFIALSFLPTSSPKKTALLLPTPTKVASASATPTNTASTSAGLSPTPCKATVVNRTDPQAILPDPRCTPGVTNPLVTQDNIRTTICTVGYTDTIRPPLSYIEQVKYASIKAYGYTDTTLKDYEEDHLISLELGGNPTDRKNLWAEPGASPNEKDRLEGYLHQQVCLQRIPLTQAQKQITTNWYTYWLQAGKP